MDTTELSVQNGTQAHSSQNFWQTICGGEDIIDVEKALNSTTPHFNDCFNHTALSWPVAIFLLFGTFYQIYMLTFWKGRGRLKWTGLLIAKLALTAILLAIATASLGLQIARVVKSNESIDFASNLASVLLWLCMLDLLILTECNRRRGRRSSGIVFLAWLIFTVCGILQFAQIVGRLSKGVSTPAIGLVYYQDILYLCCYPLILLEVVLHSFADEYDQGVLLGENECPEAGSSFLKRITFFWMLKLAIQCYKRSLNHQDLWALRPKDTSASIVPRWEKHWNSAVEKRKQKTRLAEPRLRTVKLSVADGKITTGSSPDYKTIKNQESPSLIWNLIKTFKWQFLPAICLKVTGDILSFASPLILKALLAFIDDPSIPLWIGLLFAFLMLLCNTVYSVFGNQAQYRMNCLAMNVRTSLTSTVYKKALRLSTTSKKGSTTGQMVNLMAVDIQRISDLTQWMYQIWSTPIMIGISLYLLHGELGLSALAGFGVMLLLIPINFMLGRFQRMRQVKMMAFKDQRMKLMNEILNGIKVLKLYAWEPPFEKKVQDVRKKEVNVLKVGSYFEAINGFTFSCAPFLIAVASFAAFVLSSPNNILTAQTAFVSLSLFNMLRPSINMLPMIISAMVQASVSNKRLKKFLAEPELNPDLVNRNGVQAEAISIENGIFAWDESDESSTLTDINLSIQPGQLVAIVGPVGCGKSSLLSAMLGDMEPRGGVVSVKGSIAYVPQQAWIQSLSLKNNITFTSHYSVGAYNRVVDACALRADFEILPSGDATEIGEKGINLSGGQKQRVSLARAVYQDRDVYLMDDPLSAVDAHVGRHIFDQVIGNQGMLKGKTRVLVTHGLAYLKHMDNIFVMKDGRVSQSGTLVELVRKGGPFAEFLEMYLTQRSHDPNADPEDALIVNEIVEELQKVNPSVVQRLHSTISSVSTPAVSRRASISTVKSQEGKEHSTAGQKTPQGKPALANSARRGIGQNSKNEKVQKGKVQWRVYRDYMAAVGYLSFLAISAAYVCSSGLGIGLNLWLSEWSQDSRKPANASMNVDTRLAVYAALGIGQGLFVFVAVLMTARFLVAASAKLHQRLLNNLLRSPMSFYDVTPLGAIISRVGKDVDTMDGMLPMNVRMFINQNLNVISSIIVIIVGTPIVGVAVVPLAIVYYLFQKFFVCTSRQLRRLESASRAPIYSHFGETISGATSIRAYGVEKQFIAEADFRLDENMRAVFPAFASNSWMSITLQCIGNFLVLFAALFAVLMRDSGSNAGLVGLSITYAMTITASLMMSVFTASNLETNIVAVERIKEYIELPTEAPWTTSNRPPKEWPAFGVIDIDHLELRYREGLDLVLKGLTWHIDSNEKVGVVGRTGAGKSSTTLALFRIVEAAGGKIMIDGIDISKIGLHDLRSRLAIIPQDPILFSGSLRSNLDPFDDHEDTQVWAALEQAHLKPFVSQLSGALQYQVTEGGENLSVGQRQLLCLARALLRRSRILVLDEATAAVDLETERLILDTIRSAFADCTIITIAHRLNTIIDNDKVLIMSQGRALEHSSPSELLSDPTTAFHAMAKDAGLIEKDQMQVKL